MMPSSEPQHERDKPAIALPVEAKTRSAPLNSEGGGKASQAIRLGELHELDDFGLPVKKTKRGPDNITGEETAEHGSELHDDVKDRGDLSSSRHGLNTTLKEHEPERSVQPNTEPPLPLTTEDLEHATDDEIKADRDSNKRVGLPEAPRLNGAANGVPVLPAGGISEWSHQVVVPQRVVAEEKKEDDTWHDMPAYGQYDVYDDDGRLVARATQDSEDDPDVYSGIGGAGKGYTRVQIDEDAKSATSMDENTSYLFKDKDTDVMDEDEEQRDPLAQMQATKDLLTEGQRIAYVGVTRLAMVQMVKELEDIETTRATKKELRVASESMKMWSQKMMVRLYAHMEIDSSEQIMIEQLAEHGVQPGDLTPALMQNSRVKNPMAGEMSSSRPSMSPPNPNDGERRLSCSPADDADDTPPPAYDEHKNDELPEVRSPTMLPLTKNIDIDLRWTVLCDLFLVLIADSIYDARSRLLLERVGAEMDVPWLEICRFEKRVTDALEMQEAAHRENWDEAVHMESRRKMALKRKYMMMGLATVGGSLVIGLSAGLLAPVIGAGLAAGFTTIGVAGTSGFLAGAGGTALITSGAVVTGGTIAVRASHRRTGAVKTFEYRPLHNNKRVNLIVTISGWMNGKVDDVRLPYSTVDPVMGDMYSVLWEPEMLQSMGDTIRILATEALTQGLQQVLASTILTALMASLTLPIILTKLSYLIDNPWTVSCGRASAAGLILADSLVDRNLGARPITLVGFSLGSRVIFSCLQELANKGAFGLVQNVYLFGAPLVAKRDEYLRARTVISGRFVNGYASNDWILGYLFRATSGGISRVAGLAPVEGVPGLENINVTELVNGHMAYRAAMPRLLRKVGWEVESDEFTEIEDPDPDNHEKRQRELIKEIDEARKEAETKPEKKRFGFFKRGKLAEKKGWETYDEKMKEGTNDGPSDGAAIESPNILFDIDAIRAELASEQMEVRQLESTLPPMKLDMSGSARPSMEKPQQSPYLNLRESKSYDDTVSASRIKIEDPGHSPLPNGYGPHSRRSEEDQDDFDTEPPNAGNIAMTFGPVLSPPPTTAFPPSHQIESLADPSPDENPQHNSNNHTSPPHRPGLKSIATMPASLSGLTIEHNAWAEDEDEFGTEKEMKLSFE